MRLEKEGRQETEDLERCHQDPCPIETHPVDHLGREVGRGFKEPFSFIGGFSKNG